MGEGATTMTTFGELKCEVCSIPGSDTALFRANPKGETGRWRCEPCMSKPGVTGEPIADDVLAVTDWFTTENISARSAPKGAHDAPKGRVNR